MIFYETYLLAFDENYLLKRKQIRLIIRKIRNNLRNKFRNIWMHYVSFLELNDRMHVRVFNIYDSFKVIKLENIYIELCIL